MLTFFFKKIVLLLLFMLLIILFLGVWNILHSPSYGCWIKKYLFLTSFLFCSVHTSPTNLVDFQFKREALKDGLDSLTKKKNLFFKLNTKKCIPNTP